jgi:hypothetical protein
MTNSPLEQKQIVRLHPFHHPPMRPGRRNIKLLRIDLPSVPLIKSKRRHAGVAPEQTHVRLFDNLSLGAREQFSAKTFALLPAIRRHPAKLPRRFIFVRGCFQIRSKWLFLSWLCRKNEGTLFLRRVSVSA